jgi:hypothetical protein
MMRKRFAPLIAITATLLLLAACGVDPGDGGRTPSAPTPTPTDAPTATPVVQLDVTCVATEAYALEHLVAVIGEDLVPTAFDAINSGGCDFSEPIVLVVITLRNDTGEQVVELALAPTTHLNVSFADAEGLPVIDATLAPGRYERTVVAFTADGRPSGAIAGFDPVLLVDDVDSQQADLLRAQNRWERGWRGDYVYETAIQCFCLAEVRAPVDVTVVGGEIASMVYATSEFTGTPAASDLYLTIDGLFAFLQDAIDQDAHRITVRYDAQLGYPVEAFIDFNAMMAGEERGFTAKNVRPL